MTFITIFGLQNLNADAASLMEPSCNGPLEMEKFQTYRNLLNFVCLANYRAAWRVPEKTKRSWGHIIKFLDFPCIQNLNPGAASLMEPSCNGPLEMEKIPNIPESPNGWGQKTWPKCKCGIAAWPSSFIFVSKMIFLFAEVKKRLGWTCQRPKKGRA